MSTNIQTYNLMIYTRKWMKQTIDLKTKNIGDK